MKAYHKISEALRVVLDSQKELNDILGSGPAPFYVEKLELYVDTLFSRFAPFKVGDRVRLTKDLGATLNVGHGWYCCRKMLCKGATAVVKEVDLNKEQKFIAGLVFDNDFIVSGPEEKIIFTDRERRGIFNISEDSLEVIE